MITAYIEPSRGRLQVIIKCVHVHTVLLGIYDSRDESAHVELSIYKLGILGKRLFDL
jgi:hypothetical protein